MIRHHSVGTLLSLVYVHMRFQHTTCVELLRKPPSAAGAAKGSRWRMAQEGLLALWRGWLPSVIGVVPYVGLNFAVYETSKDVILKHYGMPSTSQNCWMPSSEI